MYRVSDDEVEFILNDIKQRGVEMEDLQLNLLDHICCILEKEKQENEEFETAYQKVIKQFFKHELWEIEEETILLLKYKNYYKMKRFLYILLFVSISFNVFVLARIGYSHYNLTKWQNELKVLGEITFKEGFRIFTDRLSTIDPESSKKKYIYVSYPGEIWPHWTEEIGKEVLFSTEEDTSALRRQKASNFHYLELSDSIANIYKNKLSFVFAYQGSSSYVDSVIKFNKEHSKNIIFIKDVPELIKGYENDNKLFGTFHPQTFILSKEGEIICESHGTGGKRLGKKLIRSLNNIK